MTASPLERVIAETFPAATVESVVEQTARPGNQTVRVSFTDRTPVYVKVATDTPVRLCREVGATRHAAAHTSVGTPEIVAADPDAEPPYLVTEPLAGDLMNEHWTGETDRIPLLRTVGETIARVHEATFDTCGTIVGWDGDRADVETQPWTETLCATIEWRADDWFSDRFADLPAELVGLVREVDPALGTACPTLLHADPSRINIHVDPPGLLDWERALVGDPAFDLVETVFHHVDQYDVATANEPEFRQAIYDGYRTRRGHLPANLDRYEPLYWAISHMLVAQSFDEWAPTVDQPIDDLEAQVRAEATERIAAAREALC